MKRYLESNGININKPFCCLSPDHNDKKPSMSYDAKRNRVKCFSCGADYDLFGLIKAEYNIGEDKEVYDKMRELGLLEEETEKQNYLQKRGISQAIQEQYGIRYGKDTVIIPTEQGAHIERSTGKEKAYRKSKGQGYLFNGKAMDSEKPIFVVEGEIDALSIAEVGGEAIALGGASNVSKLQIELEKHRPAMPLILALDNDEAGEKATANIVQMLTAKKIAFVVVDMYGECKDANELLTKNRKMLIDGVNRAIEVSKQEANREITEYEQNSAQAHLGAFMDGVLESADTPAIPTGFIDLDNMLDGGLYEGLYGVGAISSLGKTTFIVQMMDQIAMNGQDVLYISLEMARTELMAKSISRLTCLEANRDKHLPKTIRGITDGKRYPEYSEADSRHISDCIEKYGEFAKHIYIIEGMGNIGANDVREMALKHKKITGRTPVIMIDYLQLLASPDIHMTERQTVDHSVMALKRLSRDMKTPVIIISSLNRNSYTKKMSMEAFKESGAIEYSTDVLIGLQAPECEKEDIDAYKNRQKRAVELVILKNRNGRTGGRIEFDYVPMFNAFYELGVMK